MTIELVNIRPIDVHDSDKSADEQCSEGAIDRVDHSSLRFRGNGEYEQIMKVRLVSECPEGEETCYK